MKLEMFIKMVLSTAEIETEDLTAQEIQRLNEKIVLYANAGMDAIVRETYPLKKSVLVQGPADFEPPAEWIKLVRYRGGKAEQYVDEDGKEHLLLKEDKEYRITYTALPTFIESPEEEYTFAFPLQVITALIYYCAYHILAVANDKREYSYLLTLYNQQCVNIAENLPKRLHIEGGGGCGI
ncbi:MAG: hypothetical protein IJN42_01760 [Clostridia bacterium]|nr:hypothetical protein [Clostridia bacterium]